MSKSTRPIPADVVAYIADHAPPEDPFLTELRAAAERAGIPAIHIAPVQGHLLTLLVTLLRAREVLEVGTLGGYSAICMARGLPADGRLRTVEISPEHAAFAQQWADRSDVAGRVEVLQGAGRDVLPTLPDASADLAFLDADKVNYPHYLEECLRILRPGGVILADNAFAFGHLTDPDNTDDSVLAIRAFNDLVAAHPRLDGQMLAVGDGMWLLRVLPA